MNEWLTNLARRFHGERRSAPRPNAEQAEAVRRQWIVASRVAKRLGTTPEELLDYHRADGILANGR